MKHFTTAITAMTGAFHFPESKPLQSVIRIKTSGSESRGQEEAACMHAIRPMRPLQQVITRMAGLNF